MGNILRNLKESYSIRSTIYNKTPIDLSVKFLINIGYRSNESNESSNKEYIEVPNSSEKSSNYFKLLKYTIPIHYDGVFD